MRRVMRFWSRPASTISCHGRGAPNRATMSVRLKKRPRQRRNRDDIDQSSENSERRNERSLFAARPQKTDTGTRVARAPGSVSSQRSRRSMRSE